MNTRLEDFTPTTMLMQVQRLKYKLAIFPIALVVLGFVIFSYYENDYVKISSMVGLFLFLGIIYLHRVYRPMPPQETGICLAPVHGTVVSIEGNKLTIEKKALNYVDIRSLMTGMSFTKINEVIYGFQGSDVQCELTGNHIHVFADEVTTQGRMKGATVGKCTASMIFPQGWTIDIATGEKVVAGETIIGRRS